MFSFLDKGQCMEWLMGYFDSRGALERSLYSFDSETLNLEKAKVLVTH